MRIPVAALALMLSLSACTAPSAVDKASSRETQTSTPPDQADVRAKYVNGKNYLVVHMGLGGVWLVEKPLLLDVSPWGGTYLVKPRTLGGIDAILDESGDAYEFMFEKQTKL
jgi:hypothetical protein